MMGTKIVILSNEPWGDVWYSKQRLAYELAQQGYDVLFVNPPCRFRPHIMEFSVKRCIDHCNIKVLNYFNILPARLGTAAIHVNGIYLMYLIKRCGYASSVLWQFDPLRYLPKKSDFTFRIFHVVDPYKFTSILKNTLNHSHIIVLVSNYYKSRYKHYNKTVILPHGFLSSETVSASEDHGYILYIGTLNDDVSFEILEMLFSEYKERLLIIGPFQATKKTAKQSWSTLLENGVNYKGAIHHDQLNAFVALAKVCIVPYSFDFVRHEHRTPLKINNYIINNKYIVTSITEDYWRDIQSIYHAKSLDAFIELVRMVMDNKVPPVDKDAIIDYVEHNRLEIHVRKVFDGILSKP